jgi:uncharacterized FlaG/YvyC family protein
MVAGQTISQNDINLKIFERLNKAEERAERFQERMEERAERFQKKMNEDMNLFRKDMKEDMKVFNTNINTQIRWNLIIFVSLSMGILYKLLFMPIPVATP